MQQLTAIVFIRLIITLMLYHIVGQMLRCWTPLLQFMPGLQDQHLEKSFSSAEVRTRHLQPDTEIGGDEVHQAEPGGELPPVDVHLLVQEDKVHLEEDENKLETGTQEPRRKVLSNGCFVDMCGIESNCVVVSLVFT